MLFYAWDDCLRFVTQSLPLRRCPRSASFRTFVRASSPAPYQRDRPQQSWGPDHVTKTISGQRASLKSFQSPSVLVKGPDQPVAQSHKLGSFVPYPASSASLSSETGGGPAYMMTLAVSVGGTRFAALPRRLPARPNALLPDSMRPSCRPISLQVRNQRAPEKASHAFIAAS